MSKLPRADRDLVALTVLALLSQGERHVYDMHRQVVDTHKDFVTGLPRSMYHAVQRLARDGLVTVADTGREGNRPERTLYRLTEDGRSELRSRTRRLLATPDPDATLFTAALSFLGCLRVAEAHEALQSRATALTAAAAGISSHLDDLGARLPRLLLVELQYEFARVSAERDWIRALLTDLDTGDLTWPENPADIFSNPNEDR